MESLHGSCVHITDPLNDEPTFFVGVLFNGPQTQGFAGLFMLAWKGRIAYLAQSPFISAHHASDTQYFVWNYGIGNNYCTSLTLWDRLKDITAFFKIQIDSIFKWDFSTSLIEWAGSIDHCVIIHIRKAELTSYINHLIIIGRNKA